LEEENDKFKKDVEEFKNNNEEILKRNAIQDDENEKLKKNREPLHIRQ
jgi:hypothetical protein